MPLNVFYTMVQKSQKWPKTQIKGGPAKITKQQQQQQQQKQQQQQQQGRGS